MLIITELICPNCNPDCNLQFCSRCGRQKYCCKQAQTNDWSTHKLKCRKINSEESQFIVRLDKRNNIIKVQYRNFDYQITEHDYDKYIKNNSHTNELSIYNLEFKYNPKIKDNLSEKYSNVSQSYLDESNVSQSYLVKSNVSQSYFDESNVSQSYVDKSNVSQSYLDKLHQIADKKPLYIDPDCPENKVNEVINNCIQLEKDYSDKTNETSMDPENIVIIKLKVNNSQNELKDLKSALVLIREKTGINSVIINSSDLFNAGNDFSDHRNNNNNNNNVTTTMIVDEASSSNSGNSNKKDVKGFKCKGGRYYIK